jgi:hypothetical protein
MRVVRDFPVRRLRPRPRRYGNRRRYPRPDRRGGFAHIWRDRWKVDHPLNTRGGREASVDDVRARVASNDGGRGLRGRLRGGQSRESPLTGGPRRGRPRGRAADLARSRSFRRRDQLRRRGVRQLAQRKTYRRGVHRLERNRHRQRRSRRAQQLHEVGRTTHRYGERRIASFF